MGVQLRKKINSDNTTSLYLDIYHNKKRSYEFLKHLKLITKPKNPLQKQNNRDAEALAKKILINRQHELEGNDYDVLAKFKQQVDFTIFFKSFLDKYTKKDKRILQACYNKFLSFLCDSEIKHLSVKQLNVEVCHDFKTYLSDNLTGESPANYFKKFKLVVKAAIRKNLILKDPTEGQHIKITQGIKKNILTPDEIKLLHDTPCTNDQMKRAFLFCLYTGLRFSDIQNIRHGDIDKTNMRLEKLQQKTGQKVSLIIHPTAFKMIGESNKKAKDFVFDLPSSTAVNKALDVWAKKAGINKHITWHCSRHSFATNIIFFGADVNTASKLLGHTSFRYTERYTHIVKSLTEKAINNLPEL